jgi:hypothetical protein
MTQAEDKLAAQVLQDLMQTYVKQGQVFAEEARRQSLVIAARSGDPGSDDYASLMELAALDDEDAFADK